MIDFTEIPSDTDDWELFARDLLAELGFAIESPPDRGPDQGKDLLVLETVSGKLGHYTYRWLVSCKHYAKSKKSVSESDEPNVIERLRHFKADGFMGFYSTLPSSGLNTRLQQLRNNKDIWDYQIFDRKRIEDCLYRLGSSRILTRYLPESARRVRPLHKVLDEYVPINCAVCNKDLLKEIHLEEYSAVVAHAQSFDNASGVTTFEETYVACKRECDRTMESRCWERYKRTTIWFDLSDLFNPAMFLREILMTMSRMQSGHYKYSDDAFEKLKELLVAVSQKVLPEMTDDERERFRDAVRFF